MALTLTACKTNLSEITDEQLVTLLGKATRDDRPAQITIRTRECIEILGGINEVVYRDMPEELLGLQKTECRMNLKGWLDDPTRNSTELTLEDFERADLAERIIAVATAQEAALDEHRAAEHAAIVKALKDELAKASAAGEELEAALQERRKVLAPACETLVALHAELKQKNRMHRLFSKGLPPVCYREPLAREVRQVERFLEQLADFKLPTPGDIFTPSVPALPHVDLGKIDEQIATLEAVAAEYRAALAEN